eukprot:TRINITY_DN6385_c0_g1_i1.p1 TRINITY_DN6385_c0_g1~~TRINITY_DN6385_c0_g1_i1.p1  ORF type:complete len:741 (+),score=104.64 TRINITY_DN6385_c0_g1_i1:160-2382(+)
MVDSESLTYMDDLIEKYLLFRGFTATHKAITAERKSDRLKAFNVQKIVQQLFWCVHNYNINEMKDLWDYLNTSFFTKLEDEQAQTVQKLELSLKRYYVVFCIQTGKTDKALEFFQVLSSELSTNRHWKHWFVLPYLKNPEQDPTFRVFFNKLWVETFSLSLHNFLSTVFRTMPLPRLLNFNVERNLRRALEGNILALKQENEALRSNLHNLRREMERVKASWPTVTPVSNTQTSSSAASQAPNTSGNASEANLTSPMKPTLSVDGSKTPPPSSNTTNAIASGNSSLAGSQQMQNQPGQGTTGPSSDPLPAGGSQPSSAGSASSGQTPQPGSGYVSFNDKKKPNSDGISFPTLREGANTLKSFFTGKKKTKEDGSKPESSSAVRATSPNIAPLSETPPSPSLVRQQSVADTGVRSRDEAPKPVPLVISRSESFSASGAITSCKFSPDGTYMACGTAAGNVRIWPLSMQAAKNSATIYGSSEILSLEWETKTGKLLLCGTGDAKIKVWSVGGDRVIGDLQLPSGYARVRKIACNPVDQSFACAATSQSDPKTGGALFTWNLRTLQPINKIDLQITVNCFAYNHNGTMMIAGCSDGTVRLLDMSNMTPIVVWKAHNEPVLNVNFSTDETTIYTLGADSQLLRWSVHSPGKVLKQYQYEGLPDKAQLADIAFEADGRYFIVPSKGQSAPIYHSEHLQPVQYAGKHGGAVTTCDWHPIDPLCVISGSTDGTLCMTGMGYDLSEQI